MGLSADLGNARVGWWAGAEQGDPLAALSGTLLRAELSARCPGLSPVLVYATPASWPDPGFTGEPVALYQADGWDGQPPPAVDIFVASGAAGAGGAKAAQVLAEAGAPTVAVAPEESWGLEPHLSVGSPFAVPEPTLLAARHLPRPLLAARAAYLRVVEGLPEHYVLVENSVHAPGTELPADLELALRRLAEGPGGGQPVQVMWLVPAALGDDPSANAELRERRAETEEGRYQPEDWPGYPGRPHPSLRVTSPVDVAAAVAAADVVVASSGAMMALAWALGVPHVALAPEESPASAFAAWTGDASALAPSPGEIVATINNIFARTGRPPGFQRLEATLDQSLDESAEILKKTAAEVPVGGRRGHRHEPVPEARLHELQAVNEALRQRLAAERLRFGERAALLEKAANTSVESAIKAVHGQDLIVRRRLEAAEKEMKRLQEETAEQQAELRAIHAGRATRALGPARDFYERLRKAPH